MKKWLKIILIIFALIILFFTIDMICIFTIKRPLFGVKKTPYTYAGVFYNVYNCPEYSASQIKLKSTKFSCAVIEFDIGDVNEIVDTAKEIKDFACAEALESFYEDEQYIYYYSCIKSKYVIVRYKSGFEETVKEALENETISITDLDKYNINYIKYAKE